MTLDEAIEELTNQQKIRFSRLLTICEAHFGSGRVKGSHHIFSTPWFGDPRINLQRDAGGQAKTYQVRQVLNALLKLQETNTDLDQKKGDDDD